MKIPQGTNRFPEGRLNGQFLGVASPENWSLQGLAKFERVAARLVESPRALAEVRRKGQRTARSNKGDQHGFDQPAAAMVRLQPGDAFALTAAAPTPGGTVVAVDLRGLLYFQDDTTGRTLMADLAHWDGVQLPAPLKAAS